MTGVTPVEAHPPWLIPEETGVVEVLAAVRDADELIEAVEQLRPDAVLTESIRVHVLDLQGSGSPMLAGRCVDVPAQESRRLIQTRMRGFELGTRTLWVMGSIGVATEPTVWEEGLRAYGSDRPKPE